MSDTPQGPGWWQASDGKWYAPHLHPDYAAQTHQTYHPPEAAPPPRRSRGLAIAIISAVVLLIVVGVGVGIYVATQANTIGLGSGIATITWKHTAGSVNPISGISINPPPQPFTGSIEGRTISGTSTFILPGPSSLASRSSFSYQRYTGTFDGKAFNLKVTVTGLSSDPSSPGSTTNASFVVDGTWGSDKVHAVVPTPTNPNGNTAGFHGTVGQWKVTGTITGPTNNGSIAKATASFTVSQ